MILVIFELNIIWGIDFIFVLFFGFDMEIDLFFLEIIYFLF